MKSIYFALTFLLLINYTAKAQESDIPDYRNKRESFKKLLDKDLRSDLACFALGALDEAVSKQPLAQMPIADYKSNFIRFEGDKIAVIITAGDFDKTKHKLLYYDEKYLTKIDNKPFFATRPGDVPKKAIEAVTVIFGRDTIHLPATAFNDLYEPVFCKANTGSNTAKCNTAVYFSNDKNRMYIYMLSSDGSNGYEVTWVLQNKLYVRRVVDYGF
ncbi:MAG TPA: hypothetical protein PLA68_04625 [Panacibacter sp.]|nr:hypothetical protein [Panacibacter sp.]